MKDCSLQPARSHCWFTILRSLVTPFRSLLIALFLAAGVLALAPQDAGAQTVPSPEELPATWFNNIGTQLSEMIRSPSQGLREDAMVLLIELKRRHGAALDVSTATPALLRLAEDGPTDTHRILAITALYEMRDPAALQALAEQVHDDPPSRVRRHAARVLAVYRASVR